MKQISGLIFDLDGVICDTAKYHYAAWSKIASELGISFSAKENERIKGIPRMGSLDAILKMGGKSLPLEKKEALCKRKNSYYLSLVDSMTRAELLPGVYDFIQDARRKGYRVALGSASKNSPLILERLKISSLFDAVIDGNLISRPKPEPEVFLAGARALGLVPEACLVFEDSPAGIKAACAGNMQAVGIGKAEELPGSALVIPDFSGVTIEELLLMLEGKTVHAYEGPIVD